MAETRAPAAVAAEWRRLSPWSVLHFAARTIAQSVRELLIAAPATYGAAQSPFAAYAWTIPALVAARVVVFAVLGYLYFRFRVHVDAVEVRSGVLFKKRLDLSFARIQNVSLEDPFYFRPFGLVTLKLDSAGAAGEEVHLAALARAEAEALRAYVLRRKRQLGGDDRVLEPEGEIEPDSAAASEVFFTRSVADLIVHGLTNNRAYLAIAGIMGLVWQADLPVADWLAWLGIDVALILGSSVGWLVLLAAIAFVGTGVSIAGLSVLVALVVYYGFAMSRVGGALKITRGLVTRHETHVQKSRIQAVAIRQDWLEFLLGRCTVVLEQISHRGQSANEWQAVRRKILVPAVRAEEIGTLTGEVLGWAGLHALSFAPISRRYFWKHAALVSLLYVVALAVLLATPVPLAVFLPFWLAFWAAHLWAVHMTWRRAGLAVDGDIIVARSGTIGVNYDVFPAFKIQNVAHRQSVLQRRHDLSDVLFWTAASRARVPYLPSGVAKSVVDYCAYAAESSDKSWM